MKKAIKYTKPIEVDFHDVTEIESYQDVNVNKVLFDTCIETSDSYICNC